MWANKIRHLSTFPRFFIRMLHEGWRVGPQTTFMMTNFFQTTSLFLLAQGLRKPSTKKNKYLPILPPVDWCPVDREWSLAQPLLDWSPGTAPLLSAAGWGCWRTATSPSHPSTQGNSPGLPEKGNVLEKDHRARAFSGVWSRGLLLDIYVLWRMASRMNKCFLLAF